MVFQKGQKIRLGKHQSDVSKLKMSIAKSGIPSPRKGKTLIEIYGKEKAEIVRKNFINRKFDWGDTISKAKKGVPNPKGSISLKKVYAEGKYNNWIKGKTYEEIYGKEKADIIKKNMGKQNIGRIGWNKGHTKETDERVMKYSENCIFKDQNFGEKYKDKIQEGLQRTPTSYEQKICNLCLEYNLPFIYTGDGKFYIGNKNPDFVDKERKIIVDVYDSYFKIKKYGSVENYQNIRKEFFKERGWSIVFIDENDIKNNNWKSICLNKIQGEIK